MNVNKFSLADLKSQHYSLDSEELLLPFLGKLFGFIETLKSIPLPLLNILQRQNILKMIWDALLDFAPFMQFKKRKKHHGGVLLLVKLQSGAFHFTKSNTPPWVFFTFFKLYKWPYISHSPTLLKVTLLHGYFSRLF